MIRSAPVKRRSPSHSAGVSVPPRAAKAAAASGYTTFRKRTASSNPWSLTQRRTRAERGSSSRWKSSSSPPGPAPFPSSASAGTSCRHPAALALDAGGLGCDLRIAGTERRQPLLGLTERRARALHVDRCGRLGLVRQHQHRVVLHLDEPARDE